MCLTAAPCNESKYNWWLIKTCGSFQLTSSLINLAVAACSLLPAPVFWIPNGRHIAGMEDMASGLKHLDGWATHKPPCGWHLPSNISELLLTKIYIPSLLPETQWEGCWGHSSLSCCLSFCPLLLRHDSYSFLSMAALSPSSSLGPLAWAS